MNEPDEDLERQVPEEPLPERDVLLEALVDVETEAAPRRRISKTLIAACVLSGLGVWQIVNVSNGGEPLFQLAAKAKTAPTKLHSDGRAPLGRVLPSTDPIAAYLERAKRGMNDREIRWMIEDFQTAGLDEEDHSLKGTLRAKQQLWYLEALSEALQLSPEQKSQAREKMDALLKADLGAFEEGIAGVGGVSDESEAAIRDTLAISPMAEATVWLMKDAYAPWNLCDLSIEQDHLTMHRWRKGPWLQFAETKLDPLSGNLVEMGSEGRALFGRIILVDTFPLTPDQKNPALDDNDLQQTRCLQAPQLRMAMLVMGGRIADRILNQLDPPSNSARSDSFGDSVQKPDELPPNTVDPETPVDPLPEPDPK